MKSKNFKKERKPGTIRIKNITFNVTGEEYTEYYVEMERWKYIKRREKGKKLSCDKAIENGSLPEYDNINQVEEEAEKNILIEIMIDAIGQLDETERQLIQLLFFDELSTRETANRLGVSQSSLVYRKAVVIVKLKNIMKL